MLTSSRADFGIYLPLLTKLKNDSFFNLEINLYTTSELDFKSIEIKDSIKIIVKSVFRNNILQNKYFDFSTSKKETN